MASYLNSTIFSLYLILTSTFFITINAIFSEQFVEPEGMHTSVKKINHLHFYFHNIVSGKNPTANMIFRGKNNVGMTAMIDDPLTEGTEHSSKIVGRAQGMYASPSKKDAALLMVVNFVFLEGKYNGSTFTILGWDPVLEMVREMPVVGGSGIFRLYAGKDGSV